MSKKFLSGAIALTVAAAAFASPQFIAHRFEIFKSAPVSQGEIIFLGNSITNFHNWNEAFARPADAPLGEQLIGNRGVSDGRAYQWKENVQVILDAPVKPAKVFICIGTNDLNLNIAPATVANDIRAIIRHIQVASPQTEIYLESILPRSGATNARVALCNALLAPLAEEMGVSFIDLSETMKNVPAGGEWSYEGLHPKAHGYRLWTRQIAPQVGLECVYGDGTQVNGPLAGCVPVVKANQYSLFPVESDDILVVSDAWGDGVLWHELVGNHNVKNRSTGSGNLSFDQAKQWLELTLTHSPEIQKTPRAIVLGWGIGEVYAGTFNAATYKQHVIDLAAYAEELAPGSQIILCQVPALNANSETNVAAANAALAEISGYPVVNLIDEGITADAWAENSDASLCLKAPGCVRIAQALSKTLNATLGEGTATPVATADFNAFYANRNRRIEIGKAYNSLYQYSHVRNSLAGAAAIKQLEDDYLATSKTFTDADVAAARELASTTLSSIPVTLDAGKRYRLTLSNTAESKATRDGRSLTDTDGVPTSTNAEPSMSVGNDLWEITTRADGTFDIKNARSGRYLTAGASVTLSDDLPETGWNITPSDYRSGSYYNIYTTTPNCQLHILSEGSVTNWSGGTAPNKTDGGCAFDIIEFTGTYVDPGDAPVESGWYEIKSRQLDKYIVTVDNVYRQNANNAYSLKYTDAAPADETRAWVYIEVLNNATYFRASNGFYVGSNGCNYLAGYNMLTDGLFNIDGNYVLRRFSPWDGLVNDPLNTEAPYVGASGRDDARIHDFKRVSDTRLANYDLWSVTITATNPTNEFRDHSRLTCNGVTVYNGGTLFLPKGTTLSAADLTVIPAEGQTQGAETPSIFIDDANKTVAVDFSGGLSSGWHSIVLDSYVSGGRADVTGWTNTVVSEQRNNLITADSYMPQSGQSRRYHVAVHSVDAERPAASFFKVIKGNGTVSVRSINGHYIGSEGSGSRDNYDAQAADTDNPMMKTIGWVVWNGSGLTNKPTADHYALGRFGESKSNFLFAPVNLDDFDVYSVNIIGEDHASSLENDVRVTYNGQGNKGIDAVYGDGAFFVEHGTPVTAASFTVPAHRDNANPLVTLSGNVLTVDYNKTADDTPDPVVTDLVFLPENPSIEKGKSATVTVTVLPAEAAGTELEWSSANDAVATVANDGTINAVSVGSTEITVTALDSARFSKSFTVTVTETSAIVEIAAESPAAEIFDLQGRRVGRATRGIYIVNGKKICVK